MKKIFLILAVILVSTKGYSQTDLFLSFFPKVKSDSAFYSHQFYKQYLKINCLPKDMSLKYFFDNKPEKMIGEQEGFNFDENIYYTDTFTINACGLFQIPENNQYVAIAYGVLDTFNLAIYDKKNDKILDKCMIAYFPEFEGIYTHSWILPHNYILRVKQLTEKNIVIYTLLRIEYEKRRIVTIKEEEVKVKSREIYTNKVMENAFEIIGITKDGIIK